MTNLKLFTDDSPEGEIMKEILATWVISKPDITLEYLSIHAEPTTIVRLGITHLPALVLKEEVIAQGSPENWVLPLLDRIFVPNTRYTR